MSRGLDRKQLRRSAAFSLTVFMLERSGCNLVTGHRRLNLALLSWHSFGSATTPGQWFSGITSWRQS
jgi:hypothetical protein